MLWRYPFQGSQINHAATLCVMVYNRTRSIDGMRAPIKLAVNNDDGIVIDSDGDVLVCVKYAITYHFLTNASLQSANKDQRESRAVAKKPYVRCRGKKWMHIEIAVSILTTVVHDLRIKAILTTDA